MGLIQDKKENAKYGGSQKALEDKKKATEKQFLLEES